MKRLLLLVAVSCVVYIGTAVAENKPGHMVGHQHGAAVAASESMHADVKKHNACVHCGMDREKFSHSRMLVTYADGSSVGVCSIHCTAIELKANKGKPVKSLEVADLDSKKLIDAEKAFWVIGGDKKGVMTKTPKWAFARKSAAEAFIKKSGGRLATYKEALALAEKD
ncbi:MAG: hypothetical protein A2X82_01165 [Geobacteraceae bacterium GWC2_55_20]|nr:MAG: hypothetical protein A2X82_01165 [Geobacteraceae bacterium GWC2_55_20]OGU25697.1 MAG: hypothetical protein A2X85_14120 [Geobacteraceae bacterium GWF2_54_21]HCE68602.1 NosL family protein [Geobacter sp.]